MGFSVLRLASGAIHASGSNAGAAVARLSSTNPRAACARLLQSIRERERDRRQSERCGYPFGGADPASRLLPCPLAARALIMTPDRRRTGRNSFALTLAIVIGSGTLTTAGRRFLLSRGNGHLESHRKVRASAIR